MAVSIYFPNKFQFVLLTKPQPLASVLSLSFIKSHTMDLCKTSFHRFSLNTFLMIFLFWWQKFVSATLFNQFSLQHVHPDLYQQWFSCSFCGYDFQFLRFLTTHMADTHGQDCGTDRAIPLVWCNSPQSTQYSWPGLLSHDCQALSPDSSKFIAVWPSFPLCTLYYRQ